MSRFCLSLALSSALLIAPVAVSAQVTFTEVGSAWGLVDTDDAFTGAWSDWDGDGDYDLIVGADFGDSEWYRNDFTEGGFLVPVSEDLETEHPSRNWSLSIADFDEDSDPDVYQAFEHRSGSGERNRLWQNNGDGTFTDVMSDLGIEEFEFTQSVMFVDFNMDGLLDLHTTMEFDPHRMYKQSSPGVFDNVSTSTGLDDLQSHSYGLSWGDIDGDGDLDVSVSTCGISQDPADNGALTIDRLWINNLIPTGTETFTELAPLYGTDFRQNMYGNSMADPDNDGDLDLFVVGTSFVPHRFYLNDGSPPFDNVAAELDLSTPAGRGHGLEWVDFDNDTDLDLYVQMSGRPDLLYENLLADSGDLEFNEVGSDLGLLTTSAGFQGSWADIDLDGDLDLFAPDRGRDDLYINNGGNENNWLFVNLVGQTDNLSGTGATIRVRIGDLEMRRLHGGQAGSFAQNWLPSHFGLGDSPSIDTISVDWLTSETITYTGPFPANQTITLNQDGSVISEEIVSSTIKLY